MLRFIVNIYRTGERGKNMKKIMVIVIVVIATFAAMTSAALAGTYTFQSRDSGGIRTDFEDLDHAKAYMWAFSWKPAADEIITSASLTFNNIYNNDNNSNWLGIYLIQDKLATGGTSGWNSWSTDKFGDSDLTPNTAVYQKTDNENVAKPFDAVANKVLVGAYSDTRQGSTIKDNPVLDFAHPALISASTPTWGWNIYDDHPLDTSVIDELSTWSADGNWALGVDPDCHFYNDGITFTIITTKTPPTTPAVPEPMSMVLGSLGLGLVSGLKRRRSRS